jgi:hypothetical protein
MALTLSGNSGNTTLDSSNGLTFSDSSNQQYAASPYGLKNRIINGDMRIDQRNAGASVTANDDVFLLDRWQTVASVSSKMTGQQNAGSVTPPAGFTNYLGITSSSAYTAGASEIFSVRQKIEGYNVSDLDFGKSTAKTITISFWVRSSLTGTFGGAVMNSAGNRCYPFTYTISSANTWEQKTITITGDTSGTWLTTNGVGLSLVFNLGTGSTYSGTAGAWTSSLYYSATGSTSVIGTNGATWYITGVQLEVGSTATPFERRLYNQELANCYRYYQQTTAGLRCFVIQSGNGVRQLSLLFPTPMRASPTVAGTFTEDNGGSISTSSFSNQSTTGVICSATSSGGSTGSVLINSGVTISAEL